MRPDARLLRREQRRAWRGMKRGRHARVIRTAYGQQHKLAATVTEFSAWCAERRAS